MSWVRNPWWDGFWIWSGLPIGIALMLFVPEPQIWYMAITIMVLETGHVVSPMILAWSKPGLRSIVCEEWPKYIVGPIAIMAGCLLLPWPVVFGVYFAWNGWHFGMQIFGISCLYVRPKSADVRLRRALLIMGLLVLQYAGSTFIVSRPLQMLLFGIVSFNHWLADIGLSSQASGWRLGFITLVLVIGVAWLLLRNGPLSTQTVPEIIAIRAAIGMIHFVYSARVWKLSDPQVRAAIGRYLFARA
jgi:hypothetical protein